jgi:hypothetical protein
VYAALRAARAIRKGGDMFEIQVLDDQGQWRDDLVSDHSEDNRFATVADAEAAMKDLLAHGDPRDGWNVAWRVVEVVED